MRVWTTEMKSKNNNKHAAGVGGVEGLGDGSGIRQHTQNRNGEVRRRGQEGGGAG